MSTEKMSTEPPDIERRIEDLQPVADLAFQYARVERATKMADGKQETDAEHGIMLGFIGVAYLLRYHPELDPYKTFFYLVAHDVDEFLHGDTPTVSATSETFMRKDLEEAEAASVREHILHNFPEFNEMLDSMSDLSIPENAYGKAFDKIAPGFTHLQNLGEVLRERYALSNMDELLHSVRATDEKMETYAAEFPDILAMRRAMHRKVGQSAFAAGTWVDVPLFDLP